MGGRRESGQPWGAYVSLTIAVALVIFGASVQPGLGATPRCRPIVLAVGGLDASVLADLHEAAARVTAASGIPFVTVEGAAGDGGIGINVATNLPAAAPGRKTVGYTSVVTKGQRFAGGKISVDVSLATGPGFGRRSDVGVVLMHELGHVLGLTHTNDPRDLMHTTVVDAPAEWSDNDRARLADAGESRGCGSTFRGSPRS